MGWRSPFLLRRDDFFRKNPDLGTIWETSLITFSRQIHGTVVRGSRAGGEGRGPASDFLLGFFIGFQGSLMSQGGFLSRRCFPLFFRALRVGEWNSLGMSS